MRIFDIEKKYREHCREYLRYYKTFSQKKRQGLKKFPKYLGNGAHKA